MVAKKAFKVAYVCFKELWKVSLTIFLFFKKKVYDGVENIVYICLILLRRNGTMVLWNGIYACFSAVYYIKNNMKAGENIVYLSAFVCSFLKNNIAISISLQIRIEEI